MRIFRLNPRLRSGFRTYAYQDSLYAAGRTRPGPKVTNWPGGESYHNFGLAYDVTLVGGPCVTTNSVVCWGNTSASPGEAVGLILLIQGILSIRADTPVRSCGGDMRWGSMSSVLPSRGTEACGLVLAALCWLCSCTQSERIVRPPADVLIHDAGERPKAPESHPRPSNPAQDSLEGTDRHGTILPRACLESLRVVDYLADLNSYAEMYDPNRSRPIELARVLPAIATSGLQLNDVNGATEGDYGLAQLEEQLSGRAGPVFVRLTHLGHICSLPLQYSMSRCSIANQEITIEISSWYRLTFVREGDGYKLRRVDYLETEGG